MSDTTTDPTVTEFDCPRCGNATRKEFYGPCTACREELRATMSNAPREAKEVEYEPKMNVTPNHVATKD